MCHFVFVNGLLKYLKNIFPFLNFNLPFNTDALCRLEKNPINVRAARLYAGKVGIMAVFPTDDCFRKFR